MIWRLVASLAIYVRVAIVTSFHFVKTSLCSTTFLKEIYILVLISYHT